MSYTKAFEKWYSKAAIPNMDQFVGRDAQFAQKQVKTFAFNAWKAGIRDHRSRDGAHRIIEQATLMIEAIEPGYPLNMECPFLLDLSKLVRRVEELEG